MKKRKEEREEKIVENIGGCMYGRIGGGDRMKGRHKTCLYVYVDWRCSLYVCMHKYM